MTTNDVFGRNLSTWLHEDAEHHVPDHLAEVLQRTAVTRQRPAWSSLERWLPMDTTLRPRAVPLPPARPTPARRGPDHRSGRSGAIIAVGALAIAAARPVRAGPQRLDRHQP